MLGPIKSIATATFPVEDINRAIPSPELSHYDRPTIFGIFDSGFVADVSFLNRGSPMVAPMIYGRDGDRLFLRCAPASRLMASIANEPICVAVTLVDGIVVGRSIFESSLNYRSLIIHGRAGELRLLPRISGMGLPMDAYGTYDPQIWAGVVPMTTAIGEPVVDCKTAVNVLLPLSSASEPVDDGRTGPSHG